MRLIENEEYSTIHRDWNDSVVLKCRADQDNRARMLKICHLHHRLMGKSVLWRRGGVLESFSDLEAERLILDFEEGGVSGGKFVGMRSEEGDFLRDLALPEDRMLRGGDSGSGDELVVVSALTSEKSGREPGLLR